VTLFLERNEVIMKKYLLSLFFMMVLVLNVNAVSSNARVNGPILETECSVFQEKGKVITGDTYFGRCMIARCEGSKWNFRNYVSETVTCKNGNLNPFIKITKDGCDNLRSKSCSNNDKKYCTNITYFDCDRTANGSKYVKPTKTTAKPTVKPTKTTSKTTETTTIKTEPIKNSNTYLSSIQLSVGSINFNKEVKEYVISIGSDVSFITVNAKAEVATSKVSVSGNTNLVAGKNTIEIQVTAEDGSVGKYIITANKEESLSNNTKLMSISINGEQIANFNSSITNYSYKTKAKSVSVEVIPEDSNASFNISDTNNLKDGSVIKN